MIASSLRWLLVMLLLLSPQLAFGQNRKGKLPRLKPGDKVIVDWAGEQVGEFVEYTGTGWLRVKVKGATGAEQTPVFPPERVRLPEKKAAGKPTAGLHTWVDTTGKYKTEATFIALRDGKVELRKADGSIAKVPLDKLSAADQTLARQLAAADKAAGRDPDDPFASTEPAPEEPTEEPAPAEDKGNFTDTKNPANLKVTDPNWAGASEVLLDDSVQEGGLTPDPQTPPTGTIANRGIVLDKGGNREVGFFENAKSIVVVPSKLQAMVTLVDEPPGGKKSMHLIRCDLAGAKTIGAAEFKGNSVPLDVDESGQFLLARSDDFHIGTHGRVDIFDVAQDEPQHVISWLPYGDRDWGQRDVAFTAFVDKDHIITTDGAGKMTYWETNGAKAVYNVALWQGSQPAVSGTGKYLGVITKGGIYVLDSATGNPLAKFVGQPGYYPRLSFSPSGKLLACVSSSLIQVWDVNTGKMTYEVYLPTTVNTNSIAWTDEANLLLGGSSLVDLSRRIILWTYTGGSELGGTVAGRYLYVAKNNNQAGLVHTPLPHGEAKKVAAGLNADSLLAIKPGMEVSVRIAVAMTQQEQQQIYDALVKKLTENGLKVVQNANLVLHATTEQGKTETVEYRTIGRGFGTESATVTQQIQKLTFTEGGNVLWQVSQVKGAPHFLHTGDKDLATAVADHTKPDVAFYTVQTMPKHLARPGPHAGAYGTATLTAQGVQ